MMIKVILTMYILASTTAVLAAEKTIYKYTDENGVTHYSETKLNDNYKPADLPSISVVESVKPISLPGQSSQQDEEPMAAGSDTQITLTQPSEGENIWGSGGKVTVAVAPLSEIQKQKYRIQFVMDDKKSKPGEANSHVFDLVARGSHQVQALLITRGQYAVAGKTDKIKVFMHQASKK